MGGSNNANSKANRVGSYQIQSSAYGNPIPWGCGAGRVDINLLFLDGYTPHEHQGHSGGKGGGGNSTNDTYTYTADVILGICDTADGPIRGLNAIYRDKSPPFPGFAGKDNNGEGCVSAAGLSSLRVGNSGQNPSEMLTNKYPNTDKVLGYDTISYLVGQQYLLNDQGGLQNHSAEVYFNCQVGGA